MTRISYVVLPIYFSTPLVDILVNNRSIIYIGRFSFANTNLNICELSPIPSVTCQQSFTLLVPVEIYYISEEDVAYLWNCIDFLFIKEVTVFLAYLCKKFLSEQQSQFCSHDDFQDISLSCCWLFDSKKWLFIKREWRWVVDSISTLF